jgi:hypothetical protein
MQARILERQKMLQTGQVLLRRLSVDFALVLPFKDSSEAAEPRCSHPSRSNCRIRLAGLRRRLARVSTWKIGGSFPYSRPK